jgi:hypothetical protein
VPGRYVRIEAYRDLAYTDQRDILTDTLNGDDVATFRVRESAVIYNALPKFNNVDTQNLSFTCLFNVPITADVMSFISGYDNETGSGLRITGRFIRYNSLDPEGDFILTTEINGQVKVQTINNFVGGVWHAMVISISNEFLQFGAYVYSITEDPGDIINHNDFRNILASTSSLTQESFDLEQNYTLQNSKLLITNLRIFNTMIREEEHDFILSQQFLKDESMLILIDNCRPQTNLPYIAKNR